MITGFLLLVYIVPILFVFGILTLIASFFED